MKKTGKYRNNKHRAVKIFAEEDEQGKQLRHKAPDREKLVVQRRRYACACKRIAETNVTFHGKGGARKAIAP